MPASENMRMMIPKNRLSSGLTLIVSHVLRTGTPAGSLADGASSRIVIWHSHRQRGWWRTREPHHCPESVTTLSTSARMVPMKHPRLVLFSAVLLALPRSEEHTSELQSPMYL